MRPYSQFGLAALLGAALCAQAPRIFAQQSTNQQGSAQAPAASGQTAPDTTSSKAPTTDIPQAPPSDPGIKVPGTGSDPTGGKKEPESKKDEKVDTSKTAKTDAIPSPGEALDPHIKKGSEDDVDAIGTRNIGHRGLGNWYSVNSEISMGKQYSMEIEKSAHMVTDPVVVEEVSRVDI